MIIHILKVFSSEAKTEFSCEVQSVIGAGFDSVEKLRDEDLRSAVTVSKQVVDSLLSCDHDSFKLRWPEVDAILVQEATACLSVSECRSHSSSWLSEGKPYQVSVVQVVTLADSLGEPAVLSPSEEATVTSDEEGPSINDEANKFQLDSLPPEWQVKQKHWNVEDPDEDVGTWLAESEEDDVPEVIIDDVDQDKDDSENPPWENGEEDNMELEDGAEDLGDKSEPDWESVVLYVGVWAKFAELWLTTIFVKWAAAWNLAVRVGFWVAWLWAFFHKEFRHLRWVAVPWILEGKGSSVNLTIFIYIVLVSWSHLIVSSKSDLWVL